MDEKKRRIVTIIAVCLVGIATGLFLAGKLLPFQVPGLQQYAKTTTSNKTVITASDDKGSYTKTVVVTVTATTPHGDFYDFAPVMASNIPSTSTNPGAIPPTAAVTEPAAGANQTPAGGIQASANGTQTTAPPTTPAYEVRLYYGDVLPPSITVPLGATVTWINKDPTQEHTITFDNGLLDMRLSPGTSFDYTFTETGVFPYHCEPHPELIGKIIVK